MRYDEDKNPQGKASMEDSSPSKSITTGFNVAMFLFSAALGLVAFYSSEEARDVPVAGLVMTSLLDMVRFLVVMFITAYFVREFWNRLITAMFSIRALTTQEAIAFVLLFAILMA